MIGAGLCALGFGTGFIVVSARGRPAVAAALLGIVPAVAIAIALELGVDGSDPWALSAGIVGPVLLSAAAVALVGRLRSTSD
jgi:hypothetical protein